jgi:polyhydroxybutyrate depolymerase
MLTSFALLLAIQRPNVETFNVGGVQRQAIVAVPTDNSKPAPLVFVFHGHGGSMRSSSRGFQIERLWPEAIVVYPDGLPSKGMTDPQGLKQGWQQSAGDSSGRDLAFFDTMLSTMKKEHRVDAKRIYTMGHSNGGRFTYLLWAERGDTFAAVAPSASPAIGLVTKFNPLPAFVVAGEKDQIVPFASQQLSIDAIRRLLKTDASKAKVDGFCHLESGLNGLELGTYIFPGPHSFPPAAVPMVVDFFKRHHK